MQFEDITFLICPECEKVIKEKKETLNCHAVEKKLTQRTTTTKQRIRVAYGF